MNKPASIITVTLVLILHSCTGPENKGSLNTAKKIDLKGYDELPVLLAENIISTNMNERDIAISPEGNEIIYTLGNFNGTKRALVQLIQNGESWSEPQVLKFSGMYQDIEPFFHPDGTKLFFASTRPIQNDSSRSDYNIWFVERKNGRYGTPENIGPAINTEGNEFYPSVCNNGNMYFTASYDSAIGEEDIFLSNFVNGEYQQPQPLDSAINSITYDFNAYISPDEDLIIFSSYGREDDLGGGDLYLSEKDERGNWSIARNLGNTINSSSLDYCPFVFFESKTFYFTSNRAGKESKGPMEIKDFRNEYKNILNGLGNIYKVSLSSLKP